MMDKKAVTEIVNYVLMVALAITMAGMVFAWMKFYTEKPFAEQSCPEVSIVISDYNCLGKILNLTVQNRGRFDVDGFTIRINNGTTFYSLREGNTPYVAVNIISNAKISRNFSYSKYNRITEIELEATRGVDKAGRPMLCENSIISQKVGDCN